MKKKNISNRELCETFNISLETVRRDLKLLEQEGVVKRVYGGAVLRPENDSSADMEPWHVRSVQNQREKAQIAAEMLLRIPDGCTIALDSGTSIFELAKLLNQKKTLRSSPTPYTSRWRSVPEPTIRFILSEAL